MSNSRKSKPTCLPPLPRSTEWCAQSAKRSVHPPAVRCDSLRPNCATEIRKIIHSRLHVRPVPLLANPSPTDAHTPTETSGDRPERAGTETRLAKWAKINYSPPRTATRPTPPPPLPDQPRRPPSPSTSVSSANQHVLASEQSIVRVAPTRRESAPCAPPSSSVNSSLSLAPSAFANPSNRHFNLQAILKMNNESTSSFLGSPCKSIHSARASLGTPLGKPRAAPDHSRPRERPNSRRQGE